MLNGKEVYDLKETLGEFCFCEKCGCLLNPKWKTTLCYSCKTHDAHREKSINYAIAIKNSIKKHNKERIYVRYCLYCENEFSTRIYGKKYCSSVCKQKKGMK